MKQIFVVLTLLMVVGPLGAQTPPSAPAPPALSQVQVLQLQNLAQRVELAQLRARLAQIELAAADHAARLLIASLQVPGYTLDLDRLVYTPVPVKPEGEEGR